jgi:hypothetical protein
VFEKIHQLDISYQHLYGRLFPGLMPFFGKAGAGLFPANAYTAARHYCGELIAGIQCTPAL